MIELSIHIDAAELMPILKGFAFMIGCCLLVGVFGFVVEMIERRRVNAKKREIGFNREGVRLICGIWTG
jgi:hypothetical protein